MNKMEFTLLDIGRLHHLTTDLEAAGALYHALGGNLPISSSHANGGMPVIIVKKRPWKSIAVSYWR